MMKKISHLFLITLFLLPLPSGAQRQRKIQYTNDTVVCVDTLEDIGHLNFFTWSAKQILDALAQGEFLKEKEWKVIEMNPELVLHIKTAADLGLKISESLCPGDTKSQSHGTYGYDDEVDAARHFIMSAYLSLKVGEEKARSFMAAHEDSQYDKTNLMDYYNNQQGFYFGQTLAKKYKDFQLDGPRTKYGTVSRSTDFFITDIKAEILRRHRLKKGNASDLIVLTSGPSVCAQAKYPNF